MSRSDFCIVWNAFSSLLPIFSGENAGSTGSENKYLYRWDLSIPEVTHIALG